MLFDTTSLSRSDIISVRDFLLRIRPFCFVEAFKHCNPACISYPLIISQLGNHLIKHLLLSVKRLTHSPPPSGRQTIGIVESKQCPLLNNETPNSPPPLPPPSPRPVAFNPHPYLRLPQPVPKTGPRLCLHSTLHRRRNHLDSTQLRPNLVLQLQPIAEFRIPASGICTHALQHPD